MTIHPDIRCGCTNARDCTFTFDAPPDGETRFPLTGTYSRSYEACETCGHWFGKHALDLSGLYGADYVTSTYGGAAGMAERFHRIMALPAEKSDNRQRVARVDAFAARCGLKAGQPRLLDVGAGLGVFPAGMKAQGWAAAAVEPDTRTVEHLRSVVGIEAWPLEIAQLDPSTVGHFTAISFNKVLEHVEDPVAMLAAALPLMTEDAFVYVEVPDVLAASDGPGREEFFVEHHHVFSPASLAMVVNRTGMTLSVLERLREPSGKYTLYAFAGRGR